MNSALNLKMSKNVQPLVCDLKLKHTWATTHLLVYLITLNKPFMLKNSLGSLN